MVSMNALTKEDQTIPAPTVVGGIIPMLPDGIQRLQQQLLTMKDGDTVEFMTANGNNVSVRRTPERLEINAQPRKPCDKAQLAALALVELTAAALVILLLANPELDVFVFDGIAISANALRGVIRLLEIGVDAGVLAEFLAKYLCP
jgi:hypothetical protein